MFGRIAVPLALLMSLAMPALPQGQVCVQQGWQLSGGAGPYPGPKPSDDWKNQLKYEADTHPGSPAPSCTYTVIIDNPVLGTGHYYGECPAYYQVCTVKPYPPPESAPETNPKCPACGEPINPASGNTYIQQADLRIPGLGGGLSLNRTWNSLWPSTQSSMSGGMFGNNWRSTYEERVFVGDSGVAKYSRSDGTFWTFQFYGITGGAAAIYHVTAPASDQTTMTYDPTNGWTMTFLGGEKRIFDPLSGSLKAIIDRNGNTTNLTYDGLNRLTVVTDPASRTLSFTYLNSSSTLVTGATTSVGIALSYSYDTNGRLIQVTKPDATTISFEYNANSLISAVKDMNGKVLESHTYDSQGRGLTSSRANGVEAVTVTYSN